MDFKTATRENPALYKYDVANGIKICKALLTTLGYSYFMLFQNPKSDNEENLIHSEESNKMSTYSSSSVVVKFDISFSVN